MESIITSLYRAAQNRGMDKEITFKDFQIFDDVVSNSTASLQTDTIASLILKKPINELTKNDINYVINCN